MNINAGRIAISLIEVENTIQAVAHVIIEGDITATFSCPLDPELRDVRDDIASIASRAADTMIALIAKIEPYKDKPPSDLGWLHEDFGLDVPSESPANSDKANKANAKVDTLASNFRFLNNRGNDNG